MDKELSPRINYVFVDFENVHETDLDRIAGKPVKVILILGQQHAKLPVPLVRKLLQYAGQVQLVETGRSGKNASDLVLANYIGEVKKADPHGYIHILSKDKDFDALIGHYKMHGTLAARHTSFSEIPVLMNLDERATLIESCFKTGNASRPKCRRTLSSRIQIMFGKALSAAELEATISRLVTDRVITLSDRDEIGYPTPTLQTPSATVTNATPCPAKKSRIPCTPKDQPPASDEPFTHVLNHLREHPKCRPARKTTLIRHLLTVLGNKVTEPVVIALVQRLGEKKQLTIDANDKVAYHL